jgi:hypothetical protein
MNTSVDQDIDLEKLEDSSHLLDILLSVENVLDSLDVYCYESWISGQVVGGPIVRRHWVTISLLYPHDKMPDPRAALRLLKHGVQVEFNSVKREQPGKPGHPDAEPDHDTDWLIKITVPRRLLDQMEGADLEMYDDEVNPDDVTAAKDIGLDDESQYQSDEQLPADGSPMPPDPSMQQPMQPQGQPNAPPPRF